MTDIKITSFTLPSEVSTVADAETLVAIWEKKVANPPPGIGPKTKYAKACAEHLRHARVRLAELKNDRC